MLIPDNINEFSSVGEQIFYTKFKKDGSTEKMYVLHSVFTCYHLKNISGELDFLVLSPGQGIFAIEIKHGRVYRKEGTWRFENRDGRITEKKTSPFSQVHGTMHSIRAWLIGKLENNKPLQKRVSSILFGTGVAFTGMNDSVDFGTEGYSWQVLTRKGLQLKIGDYINSLSEGWHNHYRGKTWYQENASRPTAEECRRILEILRGDFDTDYAEINKTTDREFLIEEFTKEQFRLLDFTAYNSRCLIEGTAGTGKTLMALELGRRYLAMGNRIALICYNHQLGVKLNNSLNKITENKSGLFFAGTLHSFMQRNSELSPPAGSGDQDRYYSEDLPMDYLLRSESLSEDEKYDLLIIDEGQDLLTDYYLEVLDSILKGGVKNGRWICFGDFCNQAIYLNKPEKSLEILKSRTLYTIFPPLKINCRNTKNIASHNTLLTGVDRPVFLAGAVHGDAIDCRFPSTGNQAEVIENIIRALLEKGIPGSKITLLCPKRLENSLIPSSSGLTRLLEEGVNFSTIQAFKGLENTIVVLFDFDGISTPDSQKLLYIGISRARLKLFMVLHKKLEGDYNKLISSNYQKLV